MLQQAYGVSPITKQALLFYNKKFRGLKLLHSVFDTPKASLRDQNFFNTNFRGTEVAPFPFRHATGLIKGFKNKKEPWNNFYASRNQTKKNMINPKPRIQQTRLMKSSNFLKKTISGIREEKDTKVLKLITLKPQTTMQRLQCNEKQQSNSSMKVLKREEKAITVRYCREKRKLTDNSFHVRKRHCRLWSKKPKNKQESRLQAPIYSWFGFGYRFRFRALLTRVCY